MSDYDISGKIGPLFPTQEVREWPMYSYEEPASTLWTAIADRLHELGWPDDRIREWLQSKQSRWAMDGELGHKPPPMGKPDTRATAIMERPEADTHTPAEFFRRLEAVPMPPSAFAARSGFSDQRPLQRWKSGAKTIPRWAWAQLEDLEQIKRLKQRARRRGTRDAAETVTEGEALEDWFQRLSELPMTRREFERRSGIQYRHIQRWASGTHPIPGWAWTTLGDLEHIKRLNPPPPVDSR